MSDQPKEPRKLQLNAEDLEVESLQIDELERVAGGRTETENGCEGDSPVVNAVASCGGGCEVNYALSCGGSCGASCGDC